MQMCVHHAYCAISNYTVCFRRALILEQRAQGLQDARAEGSQAAFPNECPALIEAALARRYVRRLGGGETRRCKVMHVDVVLRVVGVLVMAEEMLRDPHEDVEENRVTRKLRPVVDGRVGREGSVGGLVDSVRG